MRRWLRALRRLAAGTVLAASSMAHAADIKVEPGTPLREAIAQAQGGDRLLMGAGLHAGPIVIDKSLVIDGEPGAVIDAGGSGTAIKVLAPGVTVRGLTIRGSGTRGENFDSGIYVEQGADFPIIENNGSVSV